MRRIRILWLGLALCLLAACQIPLAEKQDFQFGVADLGKNYAQMHASYQIKPPFLGFNQERIVSVYNEVYWFEELPFEVVFVFDQPGTEGSLRAVESICRRIDRDKAPQMLTRLVTKLEQIWGPASQVEPADKPTRWTWQNESYTITLSTPEVDSGISWIVDVRQNMVAPMPASKPLKTLGGWDLALYGNSQASLREIYRLGEVERSRLNQKPVALLLHEVSYLGHPFQASFFFDRFTPQASLVGIDLYLLQEEDQAGWLQKREQLVETLTKMYGKPTTRRDGHRNLWVWKDKEGSLTLTDASRGQNTTWLLAFRPPPGKIAPTPALSAPRTPQDIAGWGGTRFGMSPAQVELLYMGQSPGLMRLAGSGYGFDKSLQFDNLEFKVLFLFDRSSRPPRLTQVVLSSAAQSDEAVALSLQKRRDLLNLLTAWYGPPSLDNLDAEGGGKVVWKRQSGTLEFHDLVAIKTWVLNFRLNH